MKSKIILFIFLTIFILPLHSNKASAQEGGEYSCVWRDPSPSIDTGICEAGGGCTEGYHIPENNICTQYNSADNPFIQCTNDDNLYPCVPNSPGGNGWSCQSPGFPCQRSGCNPNEDPECFEFEDDCNERCSLSEGITYNCNEEARECVAVHNLSGTYLYQTDCESACKKDNLKCTTDSGLVGINTAAGCIPIEELNPGFLGFLLTWSLGILGGLGILLILYSAFLVITSAGNPKKLQAAKEQLIATLTGIALVILSVYLLRVIGVDILKIL